MQAKIETTAAAEKILNQDDFHEDIGFRDIDFSPFNLTDHSFDNCRFESCKFREMNLDRSSFVNCAFEKSELVLCKLDHVRFNGASFRSCKVVGLNFSDCTDFGFSVEFEECFLNSAAFFRKDMRKARFVSSRLVDCDFGECDLREADFSTTAFEKVMIEHCNFEKADFRTARGYAIDPQSNKIRGARFSLPQVLSFLGFLGIRIEE